MTELADRLIQKIRQGEREFESLPTHEKNLIHKVGEQFNLVDDETLLKALKSQLIPKRFNRLKKGDLIYVNSSEPGFYKYEYYRIDRNCPGTVILTVATNSGGVEIWVGRKEYLPVFVAPLSFDEYT